MSRIVVIGNAGGGKSTLARAMAAAKQIPYFELDRMLWLPGWREASIGSYNAEHARIIALHAWVIDGVGRLDSIADRLRRATDMFLIDMPLWMHFWLAAERQIKWSNGPIDYPPGEIAEMPPTEGLFRTMWDVDRLWMPEVRNLCAEAERSGKGVYRIASVSELNAFAERFASPHSA